jgi:hypothetical protein
VKSGVGLPLEQWVSVYINLCLSALNLGKASGVCQLVNNAVSKYVGSRKLKNAFPLSILGREMKFTCTPVHFVYP